MIAGRNFAQSLYVYNRFAKLGFRVVWVENDFRYHGHRPLNWGGSFEIEILNRFAQKVRRKVTRQREIQLEVATGLAKSVAENAPSAL